jgi:hypothetical protein
MELTEEQIKKVLRDKIKSYESLIDKCKRALEAFGENYDKPQDLKLDLVDNVKTENRIIVSNKPNTLRAKIEKILIDNDVPMTSRELMEGINKAYNKSYDFNNFSGNFSQLYRKSNSNIKKYELSDVPNELKTVYGLRNWFNVDELKQEFIEKFLDAHSQKT